MNITEAIERACQEPTLIKALSFMAIWENERAVKQALEWQKTDKSTASHSGSHDTCFETSFKMLLEKYPCPRVTEPGKLWGLFIKKVMRTYKSLTITRENSGTCDLSMSMGRAREYFMSALEEMNRLTEDQ